MKMIDYRTATPEQIEAYRARMNKAFDVVCNHADWRAEIIMFGTESLMLEVMRLRKTSLEEVADAVEFMTATKLEITRYFAEGQPMIKIHADGYRKGPAGDH